MNLHRAPFALAAFILFAISSSNAQQPPNLSSGTQADNVIDAASGPALANYNGQLVITYVDDNTKNLFVSLGIGSTVTRTTNTGFPARDTPAITEFNNLIYIIYDDRNTGGLKSTHSSDGAVFSTPVSVSIPLQYVQPQLGLGLQAFNGRLYLSFLFEPNGGSYRQAYSISSADGINFNGPAGPGSNPNGASVNYGATLSLYNGGLVITTTDTDGNLVQAGAAGGIPNNGLRFKYTPIAVAFNNVLYIFGRNWAGNHNLEEGSLTGINQYSSWYKYSQRISSPPGATVVSGQLIVAGRSDSNNHLVLFTAYN